jgi:hypothetical protein
MFCQLHHARVGDVKLTRTYNSAPAPKPKRGGKRNHSGRRISDSFFQQYVGTIVEEWMDKPEEVKAACTVGNAVDFHRYSVCLT